MSYRKIDPLPKAARSRPRYPRLPIPLRETTVRGSDFG